MFGQNLVNLFEKISLNRENKRLIFYTVERLVFSLEHRQTILYGLLKPKTIYEKNKFWPKIWVNPLTKKSNFVNT